MERSTSAEQAQDDPRSLISLLPPNPRPAKLLATGGKAPMAAYLPLSSAAVCKEQDLLHPLSFYEGEEANEVQGEGVWGASVMTADMIAFGEIDCQGKSVLELGCGCGLAGIVRCRLLLRHLSRSVAQVPTDVYK
jgi:hypothetical protein